MSRRLGPFCRSDAGSMGLSGQKNVKGCRGYDFEPPKHFKSLSLQRLSVKLEFLCVNTCLFIQETACVCELLTYKREK